MVPNPLGRFLDFAVSEMGVAHGHPDVGMAQQPRDDRHRDPAHHRLARMRVAEVVEADILDAGLPPDPVPQREVFATRPVRIERRRKHVWTLRARLTLQDAPGLSVEGNLSRSRLAVFEEQHVATDLGPAQVKNLVPAAPGQQQEPDDVGLRLAPPALVFVERRMKTRDLLPGQEPREPFSAVGPDVPRGVSVDITAGDRVVHDLPEQR